MDSASVPLSSGYTGLPTYANTRNRQSVRQSIANLFNLESFIEEDDIDHDPFFKPTVIVMRKVISFYAEFVISNLLPIYFSFGISAMWYIIFRQRFEFVGVQKFSLPEILIIIGFQWTWNITMAILTRRKFHKIQTFMSKLLTTFLLIYLDVFLIRWLLTPGTTYLFTIDGISLAYFMWNYLGFSILVLIIPMPLTMKNLFIILFSSQICIFMWLMLDYMHLIIYIGAETLWDILTLFVPLLIPTKDDYTRGLYYSIMLEGKYMNFSYHSTEEESTEEDVTINPTLGDNVTAASGAQLTNKPAGDPADAKQKTTRAMSLNTPKEHPRKSFRGVNSFFGPNINTKFKNPDEQSRRGSLASSIGRVSQLSMKLKNQNDKDKDQVEETKSPPKKETKPIKMISKNNTEISTNTDPTDTTVTSSFHLQQRKTSLTQLIKVEELVGIKINRLYGPSAMLKVQTSCTQYMENGFHQNICSIIYYNLLLVICVCLESWTSVFMVLQLMGFVFLMKEGVKIFFDTRMPTKFIVLNLYAVTVLLIRQAVTPTFMKIIFSPHLPTKFTGEYLNTH